MYLLVSLLFRCAEVAVLVDYQTQSFSDYVASKSNTFAPTVRGVTPGRAAKTHDEIMASIRGGSSPNDDKPVVVEDPLDLLGGVALIASTS